MADDSGAVSGGLGSILTAGMGMVSGNPLAIASGAVGLGMSIFGGVDQMNAAKQKAAAEQNIASDEMQQDAVRRQAMELSSHRQQMEVVRNAQRARALATNNATSQGAQFGSGLQGGYGQISGQAQWNNLGISQNTQFGEQMFDISNQINQQKQLISGSESLSATGAGISKLGGALMSSFNPIKNLSGNIGGSSSNPTGYANNPWSQSGIFGG